MLNIFETAQKAASEFGLSMKDDPTLWPAGDEITAEHVRKACNATALENARSALSRALGKIAETVATEMDVAIAEDGPLADLDAVLAQHVADGPEIDLSGVLAATDWQARVEATREAFAVAVQGYRLPPLPVIDMMHYANDEPRFSGDLRRAMAALRGPEHDKPEAPAALMLNNGGDEWDDEVAAGAPDVTDAGDWDEATPATAPARPRGKPDPLSGRTRRTKAEIAEDEAADARDAAALAEATPAPDWDEEPATEAPDAGWDDAAPVATAPNLPGLATAAGIADTDMAAILDLSKSYYSQIRHGKRPWPGVKPDQVKRLRTEIAARREALDAIDQALGTDVVLKPEGV